MYQELIDADIELANDARQQDRGSDAGEWHPSGLDCLRKAVYTYKGYEPSDGTETRSIRIMQRGTEMHEYAQGLMIALAKRDNDIDFIPEVKVNSHGIVGSCDGILKVEDGPWEVQEYKSISPQGKKFLYPKPYGKHGPGNVPKAKPEHVKQARIYQRCLKEMGMDMSPSIRIVYFDRDDWSVLEFKVQEWLDVEWYEFLGEIAEAEDHVADGTLPERLDVGIEKYPCMFCPFRTRCYEED